MHTQFVTTTRGLRRDLPPLRLFEKAKKFGIWNPSEIDLTRDMAEWQTLAPDEKDVLLRLMSMFVAGEEAVTLDLLPLIQAIAQEGRLEEEMFLTTFLWEEAKHVDFFHRVITEVTGAPPDLAHYHTDNYRTVFYEALPQALHALRTDPSPAAQVRASMTYNVVVEGMLAETGYHTFFTVLEQRDILPGVRQGIRSLKQDESRHIAYGIYLLSRHIATDESLWEVVEETVNELFVPALGIVGDPFELYDPMPFGLEIDDFLDYATSQFNKRMARIEQARGADLTAVAAVTQKAIDDDDA